MFLLGKKIGMTQIFQEDGTVVPVTLIEAGPVTVTQVRTKDKDGYEAVQIGFSPKDDAGSGTGKFKKMTKAMQGHLKDLPAVRIIKEYRIPAGEIKRGDVFDVSVFSQAGMV